MDKSLIRKSVHSIEEIESLLKDKVLKKLQMPKSKKDKVEVNGEKIKLLSDRYKLFFTQGYTCVQCGITASFFALEKRQNEVSYHLNLYGYDNDGNEVLFTKDHILPKSQGGADKLENYQVMCQECNGIKGGCLEFTEGLEIYNQAQERKTQKIRCFIKHNDVFLNIKISKLIVNFIPQPFGAKGYSPEEAVRQLQTLFDNDILSDKNIENYEIKPRAYFLHGNTDLVS